MPTISVIVPVYKVEPYLHRCVDSILAQTFTDFELILVDDGSPDNSPAICDEYAKKDSRVHVIHQKNGGLSAARNAGIDWAFANSDSEWLNFVDSDDWVHPEYLERLLDAALENNVSVSICGYAKTQGEEPEINKDDFLPQIWTPEDFYVEHNINATVAWGKLYQKECFKEVRYPVGKIHEDEFTSYRILFQCDKTAVIAAPFYAYYRNPNGITGQKWSMKSFSRVIAFQKRISYFRHTNYQKAYIYAVSSYVCQLYDVLSIMIYHQPALSKYQWKIWWRFCVANLFLRRHFDCRAKEASGKMSAILRDELIHIPNRIAIRILGKQKYDAFKCFMKR